MINRKQFFETNLVVYNNLVIPLIPNFLLVTAKDNATATVYMAAYAYNNFIIIYHRTVTLRREDVDIINAKGFVDDAPCSRTIRQYIDIFNKVLDKYVNAKGIEIIDVVEEPYVKRFFSQCIIEELV